MTVHEIGAQDLSFIRNILSKYQNIEPDFTDAVLVAKADSSKIRQILTVDIRDFSIYRFSNGEAFERLWL